MIVREQKSEPKPPYNLKSTYAFCPSQQFHQLRLQKLELLADFFERLAQQLLAFPLSEFQQPLLEPFLLLEELEQNLIYELQRILEYLL
ncbi:hypothetical protein D3C80_1160450 [compost metagenome]